MTEERNGIRPEKECGKMLLQHILNGDADDRLLIRLGTEITQFRTRAISRLARAIDREFRSTPLLYAIRALSVPPTVLRLAFSTF